MSGVMSEPKSKQSAKIRELRWALVAAGFLTLDAQARALGLCRSTTWSVLKGDHKASGLSAEIVNRMLKAPHLPADAREQIYEYAAAKSVGRYGHGRKQRERFISRLKLDREFLNRYDGPQGVAPLRPHIREQDRPKRPGMNLPGVATARNY
jgi:hypothetical protein